MKMVLNPALLRQHIIFMGSVLFLLGILLQSAFSEERVPDSLVRLTPGGLAIVVEKSSQTLFLYSKTNGTLELKMKVPCSTGGSPGRKVSEGDRKTPAGVYFITDIYEDRDLSPIYGKKAFPIDYPNFLDLKLGHNGSAIWLHGTNKKLKPMDSNGCVALDNDNIIALSKYITLNSTPVILVENINWVHNSELSANEKNIMALVRSWADVVAQGSYHDYLGFYDSAYLPDIQWWEDWRKIRFRISKQHPDFEISLDQMGIYHHDAVWVVLFDCYLNISEKKIPAGQKKLFVEAINNQYRITGDVFQTISPDSGSKAHPFVLAALAFEKAPESDDYFISLVNDWRKAWSSMDMKAYADFYDEAFFSDGLNKTQWINRKKRLSNKYSYIHISAENFKIERVDEKCMVHFYQEYKSSGFSTQGTKTLIFVKKGQTWKIFQENWKGN